MMETGIVEPSIEIKTDGNYTRPRVSAMTRSMDDGYEARHTMSW